MKLSPSLEKYLLTIYDLSLKQKVHQINIAITLGYSKASISRAIQILIDQNYIENNKKEIILTNLGKQIANQLYIKYIFFYELLLAHDFDPFNAQKYSFQFMSIADDEFLTKLNQFHHITI